MQREREQFLVMTSWKLRVTEESTGIVEVVLPPNPTPKSRCPTKLQSIILLLSKLCAVDFMVTSRL